MYCWRLVVVYHLSSSISWKWLYYTITAISHLISSLSAVFTSQSNQTSEISQVTSSNIQVTFSYSNSWPRPISLGWPHLPSSSLSSPAQQTMFLPRAFVVALLPLMIPRYLHGSVPQFILVFHQMSGSLPLPLSPLPRYAFFITLIKNWHDRLWFICLLVCLSLATTHEGRYFVFFMPIVPTCGQYLAYMGTW